MSGLSKSGLINIVENLALQGHDTGEIFDIFKKNNLLNKGVESAFSGAKDPSSLISNLTKIGGESITDNDILESANPFAKVFNIKNIEDTYENVLPSAIGTAAQVEMLGHGDETFNSETYKKLFENINPEAPSTGLSQTKKFETPKPYERVKISTRTAQNQQEILSKIPNMNDVLRRLNAIAQNPNPANRTAELNKLTSELQKSLQPLNNIISQALKVQK